MRLFGNKGAISPQRAHEAELDRREREVTNFVETWTEAIRRTAFMKGDPTQDIGVKWLFDKSSMEEQLETGRLAMEVKAYESCSTDCSGSETTKARYEQVFNETARQEGQYQVFHDGWVQNISIEMSELQQDAHKASCFGSKAAGETSQPQELPGISL